MANSKPRPFSVEISDEAIVDLKERLAKTRWPDQLDDAGWNYGSELNYVKELAGYWQHQYDWRKAEANINTFSNYKLHVNGIDLHFVHERSEDPNAIPLIFSHGWPGSVLEAFYIIEQLTTPSDKGQQAFHVVVPSLPGFGFSSAPTKPGFGVAETARTFNELMLALGYTRYVAQGGDLGSAITCTLGSNYSEHCKAIHVNFVDVAHGHGIPQASNSKHIVSLENAPVPLNSMLPLDITPEEAAWLPELEHFAKYETGTSLLWRSLSFWLGTYAHSLPSIIDSMPNRQAV